MSNVMKVLGVTTFMALGAVTEAGAQGAEARARAEEVRARSEEVRARARAEMSGRGWIGITYTTSSEGGGMVVTEVLRGSPAEAAGVHRGDVIARWNGRRDPVAAAAENPLQPGDTLRLRVRRDGERDRDVTVVAGSSRDRAITIVTGRGGDLVVLRPSELVDGMRIQMDSLGIHADSLHTRLRGMLRDSLGPALRRFETVELPRIHAELGAAQAKLAQGFLLGSRSVAGAEFAEVNAGLATYFGTDHGALVLRVAPATPAARAGLESGDVVISANGHAIEDVQDLRQAVTRTREREVALEIVRRGARDRLRLRWD